MDDSLKQFQKIGFACDHAGFVLKELLKKLLTENNYLVKDYGAYSEDSVDYPDHVHPLAKAVEKGEHEFGIVICGSGNGVSMTANKHRGVRAALCWKPEIARLARAHNDANVLALPARFIDDLMAIETVNTFLNTDFDGGRHKQRVEKISNNE